MTSTEVPLGTESVVGHPAYEHLRDVEDPVVQTFMSWCAPTLEARRQHVRRALALRPGFVFALERAIELDAPPVGPLPAIETERRNSPRAIERGRALLVALRQG